MCGRFALDSGMNSLIEEFVADGGDFSDWTPTWHIRPTDTVPVVIDAPRGDLKRRIEGARWSMVPSWQKELRTSFPTFNARSETVTEKAMFSGSVAGRRALIPASGYYEWHTEGTKKTPHYIHPASGLLAFAGLYSWWRAGPASPWVLTATMLTMDATPHLAGIHDRTPVVLPRDWWDDWLNPELVGDRAFVDAAVAASAPVAESLEFHVVAPLTDADGPQLIAPA